MKTNKSLLVIDVQRGYINQFTKHVPGFVEKIQSGYDHVFVAVLKYGENSPFIEIRGRSGLEVVDEPEELAFSPRSDAVILQKDAYSAVNDELVSYIDELKIDELDLVGIDTDQCVLATAFALFDTGVKPRVLVQGCGSTGGLYIHEAALNLLRRALGNENVIQDTSASSI